MDNNINAKSKKGFRRKLIKTRSQLSLEEVSKKSRLISERLLLLPQVVFAQAFFCYVSRQNEVCTRSLISKLLKDKKIVAVPKITNGQMEATIIHKLDNLQTNAYNILEPTSSQPQLTLPEISIVPGVAFSTDGKRLGLGGGFYDRYFSQHPSTLKIALAYDFQVIPTVPFRKEFDRMVDLIVTENTTIVCHK